LEQERLLLLARRLARVQDIDTLKRLMSGLKSEPIWNELIKEISIYALVACDSDLFDVIAPELEMSPSYGSDLTELLLNRNITLAVRNLLLSRVKDLPCFTEDRLRSQRAIASMCTEAYENSEFSLGDDLLRLIDDPELLCVANIEKELKILHHEISILGSSRFSISEEESFYAHHAERIYFGDFETIDHLLEGFSDLERNASLKKIAFFLVSVQRFDRAGEFIERFCSRHPDLHLMLSLLATQGRKSGHNNYYDRLCLDPRSQSCPYYIKAFVLAKCFFHEWHDALQRLPLLDPVSHLDFTFEILHILLANDQKHSSVRVLKSFVQRYVLSVKGEAGVSLLHEKMASLFFSQDKLDCLKLLELLPTIHAQHNVVSMIVKKTARIC
jgi:hypothetical protein